jgi:hypothetical protein
VISSRSTSPVRGNTPKLLKQAEHVGLVPLLRDPPVRHAADAMPPMVMRRPVGGTPANGPPCVPWTLKRTATLS